MNNGIKSTFAPIWALGTMSGTSLDGVDAAMLLTDGEQIFDFGPSAFRHYSSKEAAQIRAAFGTWPGDPAAQIAAKVVEDAHIEVIKTFSGAALIGFHGQTVAHDPGGRGTHQVGNAARLAQELGCSVASDFRSADVAAGGQGAPLVPFFHHACARFAGETKPVAFLNLGGVGNVTWVDPSVAAPEDPHALLAFDTGPANAPMNDIMLARRGVAFDAGGALACAGQADHRLLAQFLTHPYFAALPPKSLDRDSFAAVFQELERLSDADAMATLVACIVASVRKAVEYFPKPISKIFLCGGGRHNDAVVSSLKLALSTKIFPVESIGFNGDMLEAQAFAYLATRTLRQLPLSSPHTTGVKKATSGGTLTILGDSGA